MRCRFHGLENGGKDDPRRETDLDVTAKDRRERKKWDRHLLVAEALAKEAASLWGIGGRWPQESAGNTKEDEFPLVGKAVIFRALWRSFAVKI
jgi:hypothetical protein